MLEVYDYSRKNNLHFFVHTYYITSICPRPAMQWQADGRCSPVRPQMDCACHRSPLVPFMMKVGLHRPYVHQYGRILPLLSNSWLTSACRAHFGTHLQVLPLFLSVFPHFTFFVMINKYIYSNYQVQCVCVVGYAVETTQRMQLVVEHTECCV